MGDRELIDSQKKYIEKIINDLKNESPEIGSKKYLSLIFAVGLLADVNFILAEKNPLVWRYKFIVLRTTIEQVIKYKYYLENNQLIEEFFGLEIDEKSVERKTNLFKALDELNKKRIKQPISISEMAKEIGEKKSTEDFLALYDAFGLTSAYVHDGYYKDSLNVLDLLETDKVTDNNDIINLLLMITMTRFIESSRNIKS